MDEMRVYIVNLGKYVEGKDTGAWFQCPVDYEKVKETLELDSEHEEYAIHDYELPFEIDEYIGIGELNRLCRMVEEFEEPVKKALKELIECCGDLESLYEKKDDIIYYFGCESASDCNLLEYLTQRDIQTKNSGVNVRYRGKHRFFKGFNEFIKEKTRRCDNDFEKIERHVFF